MLLVVQSDSINSIHTVRASTFSRTEPKVRLDLGRLGSFRKKTLNRPYTTHLHRLIVPNNILGSEQARPVEVLSNF
jgi:hypothetical protein